jgi:hypothetical protein
MTWEEYTSVEGYFKAAQVYQRPGGQIEIELYFDMRGNDAKFSQETLRRHVDAFVMALNMVDRIRNHERRCTFTSVIYPLYFDDPSIFEY